MFFLIENKSKNLTPKFLFFIFLPFLLKKLTQKDLNCLQHRWQLKEDRRHREMKTETEIIKERKKKYF